MDKVEKVT